MTAVAEKSLVGQVLLGRYRVLRQLALGGMGAVYLARTEGARGFSKPVVLKRILPIWGDDEEIVSLFAREARILSQLQDPGIVSVMDFGQIPDGTLVMVLDYVHGYHLAHWLTYLRHVQGCMPVEMAVHIMLRVLSALHYAHTFVKADGKPLAVIHRDVSPANILLDTSGNVKLVDFGIARAEGDEYKTEAPLLRGKFGYLAPELFTGAPPSPQTDVYAAGVVLYELLTGDNPFRGRELTDSYHKVLNVTAPPVAGLRDDVSQRLSAVILPKALARDPAQRYASAAEFADALRMERPAPDEECQARLRSAVQAGFTGPLPEALGLEPLSASDEAWRDAGLGETDQSLAIATHEPAPAVTPALGVEGPAPPPLTAAGAHAQPHTLPPPTAERDSFADIPTFARQPSLPAATATLSPAQLRWVALGSMLLFGSLVVAGVVRTFEPSQDRVIVIEREANARSDPQPEPPATDMAEEEPTVTEDSEKPGRKPAEPAAAVAAAEAPKAKTQLPKVAAALDTNAPVGPDPRLLTNAFAQQQGRVQQCFSAHAQGDVSLADIAIIFHVAESGTVERAELAPDQAASLPLGTCLLDLAKAAHFPRLTQAVTFRIPIHARVAQP